MTRRRPSPPARPETTATTFTAAGRPIVRCAIYTRQSVARGQQDFTSCEAQRERGAAIAAWVNESGQGEPDGAPRRVAAGHRRFRMSPARGGGCFSRLGGSWRVNPPAARPSPFGIDRAPAEIRAATSHPPTSTIGSLVSTASEASLGVSGLSQSPKDLQNDPGRLSPQTPRLWRRARRACPAKPRSTTRFFAGPRPMAQSNIGPAVEQRGRGSHVLLAPHGERPATAL
jgi:hypothetical protein